MVNLNLVVLAAGMGSRFGGLKQVTPVDSDGCFIIDYSIYDAIRAGANHVVFVIKKDIENDFRETVGSRVEKHVKCSYVFQDIKAVPDWFQIPSDRKKPWGTGHAVIAARDAVDGPFATINADDFYGREAYTEIFGALRSIAPGQCVMPGYVLRNVLSETGGVSRCICRSDDAGRILYVEEHHQIVRDGGSASAKDSSGAAATLDLDVAASMNMWGFAADIFLELRRNFEAFLREMPNPATDEFYLPGFVSRQIADKRLEGSLWRTNAEWSGITYKDELDVLIKKIAGYKASGIYPERLW
jgi:hypothetical protein